MKHLLIALSLVGAVALAGCSYNVNVNVPSFGDKAGSGGDGEVPSDNSSQMPEDGGPDGSGDAGSSSLSDDGGDGEASANDSGASSWKEIAYAVGGHLVGAQHGYLWYAFDTLALPGQPITLQARLQSIRNFKGVSGVKVAFVRDGRRIGSAMTDADGSASLEWTPPKADIYTLDVEITDIPDSADAKVGQLQPTVLVVSAQPANTPFVVIDLDHTVVASSFFRVLVGGASPMADSVRVARRINEDYGIIYLTHRPDLLTAKSKTWLRSNGYPAGPLLVSDIRGLIEGSGEFKTAKIKQLRKVYPKTAIGIGDKYSDAQAYVDNGMEAFLIPHYDRNDPDEIRDAARQIADLTGKGRLNVVDNWSQVEKGIFQNQAYPPDAYRRDMLSRARRLEQQQEDEEEDDDDDDEEDD